MRIFDIFDDPVAFWTFGLTIATFLLGTIALFQDSIRYFFNRPKLDININTQHPLDCHRASSQLLRANHYYSFYTFYFRFRILNRGNITANKVEVIISNLRDGNGTRVDESFVLENLTWDALSDDGKRKVYWDFITPGTFHYCNLGRIHDPAFRSVIGGEQNDALMVDKDVAIFSFDVFWRTLDMRYLLKPGKYRFNIVVGCENIKRSVSKSFEMVFSGKWFEDESTMLSEVSIREFTSS